MNIKNLLLTAALPTLALGLGTGLLMPESSQGYSTIGGSLSHSQRDFRVYNNFTDASANNNQVADPNFPGYQGALMAVWKGVIEWGSGLHGDGNGDPHQPGGLGSGGGNFDPSFQGDATGVGTSNNNIHSELSGGSGGVLAYCETPISDGWRIRYYASWTWADGPGTSISGVDLQGVACHEYGHALGLGHSGSGGATMYPSISGTGVVTRSIATDDSNGVKAVYGTKSGSKPNITGYTVSGSSVTVNGNNFDSSGNQVWFTQAGAGGNGVPIKVTNVTSNGSSITVNIPGNAGPGDILVRRNSTAHSGLSNAWPFDPGTSGQVCGITQYGTGLGGANIGTLNSVSTPTLGSSVALVATDFNGSSAGMLIFALSQGSTPLLGGTIVIDYLNPVLTTGITITSGLGTAFVTLPASPGLAYTSAYAQIGTPDPAQTFGWAFSNGLELTFCP